MTEVEPKIDFYFARTGNSLRAAIALELSNCTFEPHPLNLINNEQKSKKFLEINPAGKVPVLVLSTHEERHVLTQSGAIMEFLLNRYRQDLFPEGEIALSICKASFFAALSDISTQNALAIYLSDYPDSAQFIYKRMTNDLYNLFLPVLNSPYLFGENKTIADYAHFPVVYMREAQLRKAGDVPHIINWLKRMQSDPAVTKAINYSGRQIEC